VVKQAKGPVLSFLQFHSSAASESMQERTKVSSRTASTFLTFRFVCCFTILDQLSDSLIVWSGWPYSAHDGFG